MDVWFILVYLVLSLSDVLTDGELNDEEYVDNY